MDRVSSPVFIRRIVACGLLLAGFSMPMAAWAVDTDGDGISDTGGVTLYSTSFDTADAGWSFGQWSRINDPAAARTPSYVATACTSGVLSCRFPPVMTLTYTLPQASIISFWAKSATNSGTVQQFYIDNAPVGYFSANKYSYTQSSFLVGAGTHVFKWTISSPTSFGQPYIDDVSITTVTDNCPTVPNADQLDVDQDGQGDACDPDSDNDGVLDGVDNCRLFSNADQLNTDGDANGNACDSDDDNDGAPDGNDRWPLNRAAHNDPDSDFSPDSWAAGCDVTCQSLSGLSLDNCPALSNVDQQDADGDGQGNACESDDDSDGLLDTSDNCPLNANTDQLNTDGDGQGDACDTSPLTADKVVQLVSGLDHSCILNSLGAVKCWGLNNYGQLGDGLQYFSALPVDVVGLGSGVQAIFASDYNSCAVMNTGGLKCWGKGGSGKLGNAANVNRNIPVDVYGLDSGVKSVAIGGSHMCALMVAGNVKCWGQNNNGQFGNGAVSANSNVPVDVNGLGGVQSISAGYGHNCVVTAVGGLKCWGYGLSGEIGDGSAASSLSPVDVSAMTSGVLAVSSGRNSNCAKSTGNGLKCWGYNGNGESGSGLTNSQFNTPVDVVDLGSGVSVFSPGEKHYCALTIAGDAKCWGINTNGQLGDGTKGSTTKKYSPVQVLGLDNDNAAVVAGGDHSCVLKNSGAVMCWGGNTYGQLGDNTVTDRLSPQWVYGLGGDSDNDGVGDTVDAFPLDATESVDTDNDGIGNNADLDDDGDGVPDYIDAAPLNAANTSEVTLPLNSGYKGSAVTEQVITQ